VSADFVKPRLLLLDLATRVEGGAT
jgi:hypothetical protein